jgi:hypothetical protein
MILQREHNVKKKPTAKHNMQANVTVEHMHQTIGNVLCTHFCSTTIQILMRKICEAELSKQQWPLDQEPLCINAAARVTQMHVVFGYNAM